MSNIPNSWDIYQPLFIVWSDLKRTWGYLRMTCEAFQPWRHLRSQSRYSQGPMVSSCADGSQTCGKFMTAILLSWEGTLSTYLICGYGSIPIDNYRYILVGWTSINPSYDLGWTKGTRVLIHPHVLNQRVAAKSVCVLVETGLHHEPSRLSAHGLSKCLGSGDACKSFDRKKK